MPSARILRTALLIAGLVGLTPTTGARAEEPKAAACGTVPAGMACVPGGWFWRGTDDGPADTRPREKVWVETFYMDLTEVTTEAFQACRKAKKCGAAKPFYPDYDRPRQPMVAVSWFRAVQFCEAMGKRLPTEAEWEKAARGPDGALHPWGDEPATCERAVIRDETGRSCGVPMDGPWPKKGRTFDVGSKKAGVYGLFDMSGNSWEWVNDWYSKSWKACGDKCQGINPKGPCDGAEPCRGHTMRVVRGGSWYWTAEYATGAYRRPHYPINRPFHHFGFRCAADVGAKVKVDPK